MEYSLEDRLADALEEVRLDGLCERRKDWQPDEDLLEMLDSAEYDGWRINGDGNADSDDFWMTIEMPSGTDYTVWIQDCYGPTKLLEEFNVYRDEIVSGIWRGEYDDSDLDWLAEEMVRLSADFERIEAWSLKRRMA